MSDSAKLAGHQIRREGEKQMPGCILHVVGSTLDPAFTIGDLSLTPYSMFRKGEKRFPDNPRSEKVWNYGGFKCIVSSIDGDLAGQVRDAIEFLSRHRDDLLKLTAIPTIEEEYLDFGYECRLDGKKCCVQCDSLPPELLRLCGELGIGIELSLYPPVRGYPKRGQSPGQTGLYVAD